MSLNQLESCNPNHNILLLSSSNNPNHNILLLSSSINPNCRKSLLPMSLLHNVHPRSTSFTHCLATLNISNIKLPKAMCCHHNLIKRTLAFLHPILFFNHHKANILSATSTAAKSKPPIPTQSKPNVQPV